MSGQLTSRIAIVAVFGAATLMAGSVVAPGHAYAAPPAASDKPQTETAIDKDFGRFSQDGAMAFRDVHMARIAIYDAKPKLAGEYVKKAETALDKAKSDRSVFMKAEADLKQPAGSKAATPAKTDVTPAKTAATPAKTAATSPVAWLPVDGALTLDEDFVATPEKAKAVAEANKHIAQGDKKSAVEKLKVAGIGVGLTLGVIPLNQSISDVQNAAKSIDQGKYYEANASLKTVEDGLRFDVVEVVGVPTKAADAATPAASTAPAATAPAAKPTH